MFTEPLLHNTSSSPPNYMTSQNLQNPELKEDDDDTLESKSSDVSTSTPLKASELKFKPKPNINSYQHDHHSQNNPRRRSSLVRRLSAQFLPNAEHDTTLHRQNSLNDMTTAVSQYIPDAIANNIPGLNLHGNRGEMHVTYFCNICFTNYPMDQGFKLSNCGHMFCVECIKGYFTNKILNGRVLGMKCFYPVSDDACGADIDEGDIRQVVEDNVWDKMQRFINNLENHLNRECPYCNYHQGGSKENARMICEECGREYCLYHSNAHPMDETCASYDLRMAKEDKLAEEAIGDAKPCPRCNFRIQKNGGCNHMKCVKCGCSFCWKCMQEIEDSELPNHYKEDGPCKGMQFDGMEGEPPPRWIIVILVICACIFFLPAFALGIVFGLCFCPFATLCGCCKNDDGRTTVVSVFQACFLGWLLFMIVIAIFIPLLIFIIIFEILKQVYNVVRIVCPCLPACPEMNAAQREEHRQRQQQQQQLWNEAVANYQNNGDVGAGDVVIDIDT